MRTVRITKEDFIATVTANLAQHRAVFEEALTGYRARMIRELERRIHDLQLGRRIDQYLRLPEPEDHTEDYRTVLAMAEMSVDDIIELTNDEFAMYIRDEWRWKQNFTDSTAAYLG